MAKGPKTHHIAPNPTGGWDVKNGDGQHASSLHKTKRAALNKDHFDPH